MNLKEINAEIEKAETNLQRNVDLKDVTAIMARATWEVARQLAQINYHLGRGISIYPPVGSDD